MDPTVVLVLLLWLDERLLLSLLGAGGRDTTATLDAVVLNGWVWVLWYL
jgi:hypothetical protein